MAAKKDSCYYSVKRSYKVFPSARASQAIAKCRKKKGTVRKGAKGKSLKRWQKEKWVDTRTGKPCGAKTNKKQYCRPSKRVSSKTPKTTSQVSAATKRKQQARKSSGQRAKTLKKKQVVDKNSIIESGNVALMFVTRLSQFKFCLTYY